MTSLPAPRRIRRPIRRDISTIFFIRAHPGPLCFLPYAIRHGLLLHPGAQLLGCREGGGRGSIVERIFTVEPCLLKRVDSIPHLINDVRRLALLGSLLSNKGIWIWRRHRSSSVPPPLERNQAIKKGGDITPIGLLWRRSLPHKTLIELACAPCDTPRDFRAYRSR